MAIDVQDLDADFFAFLATRWLHQQGLVSSMGRKNLRANVSDRVWGEMIDFVYEQSASWKELPWKFEAGTPNMAGAIGLGAAIDY